MGITSVVSQGCYNGRQEGKLPPLPSSMGAGGTRIDCYTELFLSLLSSERAYSGNVESVVYKNPNPQTSIVLQGDQLIKHRSSGKKFEDKNLPLWRNIHTHRCDLRGSLAHLP